MKTISNTEYQELRNKIWGELISTGLVSDEDENYQEFDEILGSNLEVDWDDEFQTDYKGRYIGVEIPTDTGFLNVLIGMDIGEEGNNSVEYCNEADIELYNKGGAESAWSDNADMIIKTEDEEVFDKQHRILRG